MSERNPNHNDTLKEPRNENQAQEPILRGIEHIVVLMFENRSFDNLLGGLYPNKPQQQYNGLTGKECNPVCPSSNLPPVYVWQAPFGLDAMIMPYPDPGELFTDMTEQIFGDDSGLETATMRGFACNYSKQSASPDGVQPVAQNIMQYYAPGPSGRTDLAGNIPITSALAQAYAVSDQWFASGPVQTLANRIFTHCATPSKYQDDEGAWHAVVNNTDITDQYTDPDGAVLDKSVFELLDNAGYSWKVYYHDWPLSAIVKYVDDNWSFIEDGNVYQVDDTTGGFFDDVSNNRLPTYSFIEPRYTDIWGGVPNSNHPGGSDINENPPAISVCDGELLLQSVYEALYNAPGNLFEKTLLIVIYDEHGGLYDHVPPPQAVSPFHPGDVEGFDYDRYGVRVPAIFINPYIAPATIFRPLSGQYPFDHTSIISTLRKQFGLDKNLTDRDGSAPTLAGLITQSDKANPFGPDQLQTPICPLPPPVKIAPELMRKEPRPESIAAVIKKATRSAKNQMRARHLQKPKG